MSGISKLMRTEQGRILISILLGFGFAALFRASCKGKNCILYKGPSLEDLQKTYLFQSKCYTFNPVSVQCDKKRRTVLFQ